MKKNNLDNFVIVTDSEIIFQLNSDNIDNINTKIIDNFSEKLNDLFLANFNKKVNDYELIFISSYNKNLVIKTILNAEGVINNQIVNSYLEQPHLLKKIYFTHFVLIETTLKKIKNYSKFNLNIDLFSAIISFTIVILTILFNWYKFIRLNPIFFLVPILMWWLLKQGIKQILHKYLPKFNHVILRYLFLNKLIFNKRFRKIFIK